MTTSRLVREGVALIRDVEVLAAAAATELMIQPRRDRWTHLPLCVLDAVFSINARYSGVARACHAYADHSGAADPLLPVTAAGAIIGTDREQPVHVLARLGRQMGPERFAADVVCHRGRTSARGGVLKAEAAIRYAEVLASAQVRCLGDVAQLLGEPARMAEIEQQLVLVPGHGSGARLSYLWMLAGNNDRVKVDRMLLRWLCRHLGKPVEAADATMLVAGLAERVGHTAWEIDHAIWRYESGRQKHDCRNLRQPRPPAPGCTR